MLRWEKLGPTHPNEEISMARITKRNFKLYAPSLHTTSRRMALLGELWIRNDQSPRTFCNSDQAIRGVLLAEKKRALARQFPLTVQMTFPSLLRDLSLD